MRKRRYLVCYDIANPRRLGRVHRRVSRLALPVQYSVYLFHGNSEQVDRLLARLRPLINEREDDVRIYPVPERADPILGGRARKEAGLFLLGEATRGFGGQTDDTGTE